MGEFVSVTREEPGVATLRLDRPKVNALSPQVWSELEDAARELEAATDVHAVVLWGGPRVFAAGADIRQMKEQSFQSFFAEGGGLQTALSRLARLPKIVIAAINGYALGGGCELALTADFRFCAEDSQLGQPEILLGIIPGGGGTQRLPRLVGLQKAREMVYMGRFYSAEESLQMGLVDRVLPPDQVYDAALEEARGYARGPYALKMAKKALDEGTETDLDEGLRLETSLFTACFATEDARTGMASFVEQGPGKAQFDQR